MTDATVECFNCGRPNPEWAQVCRTCGVPLRHGAARTAPSGRVPTDRDSLTSIGAVVGTILAAVLIGFVLSNLNPTSPTVGFATPTPIPTEEPTPEPSAPATPAGTPVVTPAPTPALPGTVTFGTGIDAERNVTGATDTFTPGTTFAHAIAMSEPFGVAEVGEGVVRLNEDGTDNEVVVDYHNNTLGVDPTASKAGFTCCDAAGFVRDWGAGLYEMRVYRGDELIARGQFRLAEG
jgi:hypothetical protein